MSRRTITLRPVMSALRSVLSLVLTVAMVAVAVVLLAGLWRSYMLAPWTRDGRVRVEVVDVAPEVSGTVVDVPVRDNQSVHKGDVLFSLDPERFRLAIAQAQAALDEARQQMELRQADARRRAGLPGIVSAEEQERARTTAAVAGSSLASAQAALDLAKLNLERSRLHAPVDGVVTDLRLRVGDYAVAGQPRVAVIDTGSFWVNGYFEETKLERIAVGDPARIRLMGFKPLLTGHVESITRGINDQNAQTDRQGLPDVNPVFTWVRLAQRIPVRIAIDSVPPGVILAAGMTCSVSVGAESARAGPAGRLTTWLEDHL